MGQVTRVPLVVTIAQRGADQDKDGLTNNVFYDTNARGTIYASKRPGITLYDTGDSNGNGIYVYNNILFIFRNDSFFPTEIAL